MSDDADLLRRYVASGSEADFAEVVRRHVGLVYHTALRRIDGDGHLAEDITQQVFVALARNARSLAKHPVLSGWLFVATRHAAANLARAERRRRIREQESQAMNGDVTADDAPLNWDRLRPELERVMDQLSTADREALLLRFFENRPLAEVGSSLRLSENTARMRVSRALDRLRSLLERRGIHSTSMALALLISEQATTAAPSGLAATVASVATATAAATPATLISTALFFTAMNTSKIIVGLSGLVACASLGTAVFQHAEAHRAEVAASAAATDRNAARRQVIEADQRSREAEASARSAAAKAQALEKQLQETAARLTAAQKPAGNTGAKVTAPMANEFATLMANPEYQQVWLDYNRATTGLRYGRFYRKLRLNSEQIAAFEAAIQDQNLAMADGIAGAKSQGVALDDPIMQRVPFGDADAKIRALLGEAGYKEYHTFMSEAQPNSTIDSVAGNLYYTATPLTTDQADRLGQLIRDNTKRGPQSGIVWTGPQVDWPAVVAASHGVLAGPQVDVLRQTVLQAELASRMYQLKQSILASGTGEAAQAGPAGR